MVQKSNLLLSVFFREVMSEKIVFGYFKKQTIILRPKNSSFNKGQKWTYSKGVSPWILSKNRNFSYECFLRKLWWSFKKGQKIDIFQRGYSMAFCPKIELFRIGVFHRNSIRKHHFWYYGKKRMILSAKNWSFKKAQKIDIFQRG